MGHQYEIMDAFATRFEDDKIERSYAEKYFDYCFRDTTSIN